ncbi:MAG: hypothetical protein EBX68_12230, partial [Betaproteobacteria bacterium]|nr:hypothetical protein [Betaproteobacteria bacterium]
MYMREMGSVELLTREGEIEIAKRIEEGLKDMVMAISACPMTVQEILNDADAIREGNETITLKLIANVESDDKGFTYQRYNVDSSMSAATLTITDSTA